MSLNPSMASNRPLSEIADDLKRVVSHFEMLGLPIYRGRIQEYAEVLAAAVRKESVDRALLWSAACEIEDLVDATTIDPEAMEHVRKRVPGLCGGDSIFTSRSGHDQGRNLCFELVTAAMLQRVGGEPSRLQCPSDASNTIDGQLLLVECKRPTTFTALGRCITDGYRQLSEHRRAGYIGVGVLGLEVSVLVNPDFGVLVAKDPDSATTALYVHIQKVLQQARKPIARATRNVRNDAGVQLMMFRVKCMTGDDVGPPNVTTIWHLEPTVNLNSSEFDSLYRLMNGHPSFTPGVWGFNGLQ